MPSPSSEIVVVRDEIPFAFPTPGSSGEFVISSVLVEMLSPSQLRVVVAHERARLRQSKFLRKKKNASISCNGTAIDVVISVALPFLSRLE